MLRHTPLLLKGLPIISKYTLQGVPVAEVTNGKWKYVLVEVANNEFSTEAEPERPEWVKTLYGPKGLGYVVDQRPCTKCDENGHACDRSCYHKALTKPTCVKLDEKGYKTWMTGGGWIDVCHDAKTMHITGVSIALGPGDHDTTAKILSHSFPDYSVTFESLV
eukprot:TRINITY_DN2112_c0_g1_i1.p1 TRINITY_DN2112_c0_g1~~TRINITY_DN2112_c0_g1_i1.p1  ORF type:complete len:163 (+),score=11.49 TRINITY_DN2112_c0_g1_i1:109-597(+)